MRKLLLIVAFAGAFGVGGVRADTRFASSVPSPTDVSDVRCLAVALSMVGSADQRLQSNGQAVMMYYLGRIDGRASGIDLEGMIYTTAHAMTPQEGQTEAQRCGRILVVRGQELIAMGQRMTARERTDAAVQHP